MVDEFMSKHLEAMGRIADALEKIAANGGTTVNVGAATAAETPARETPKKEEPKKEEPKPAPPEEPSGPTYTIDQVRAALKEYRAVEGAPAMLEVLKTHGGADELTKVAPEKFHDLMVAVGAAEA